MMCAREGIRVAYRYNHEFRFTGGAKGKGLKKLIPLSFDTGGLPDILQKIMADRMYECLDRMAARMKVLRKEQGLSQKDMERILGVSELSYYMFERGNRSPKLEALIGMCILFGVSMDYITGMEEDDEKRNHGDKESVVLDYNHPDVNGFKPGGPIAPW